jgi:hypothetical protein
VETNKKNDSSICLLFLVLIFSACINMGPSQFFFKNTVAKKCVNMVPKLHIMRYRGPNLEDAAGDKKRYR